MGADPSMASGGKAELEALKRKVAERDARITELEAQIKCKSVTSAQLDQLSQADMKKLCLELDASNNALKGDIKKLRGEHDTHVERCSTKWHWSWRTKTGKSTAPTRLVETSTWPTRPTRKMAKTSVWLFRPRRTRKLSSCKRFRNPTKTRTFCREHWNRTNFSETLRTTNSPKLSTAWK